MKALLALDTSSGATGTAVAVGGRVAATRRLPAGARHDRLLFAAVDETLAEAGVTRADLEGVAVTRGPGGFTGLRVGLSTAKGIAFALGLPMVGISSLEALARGAGAGEGEATAALFDAKKGQVYGLLVGGEGEAPLVAEGAYDPDDFAERAAALERKILFTGSGVDAYGERFAEQLGTRYRAAEPSRRLVDPGQVALLGLLAFARGEALAPELILPVYHRLSEAEEAKRLKNPAV